MAHSFLPHRRLLTHPRPIDRYALRVTLAGGEENQRGEFVLYWAQSARRMRQNAGLDYAIEQANARGLPVVVYEGLRPDCPYANDRIHQFVLNGVPANRRDALSRGLGYVFFLPRDRDSARGVIRHLASRARLVVTDEYPTFIVREQTERFVARAPVAVHLVDGNGILPMRAFAKEQYSARFLRDLAHRFFPDFWSVCDEPAARKRWRGDLDVDESIAPLHDLEIDHGVRPVATAGGRDAALLRLEDFVAHGLGGYAAKHNRELKHTSGLSPYLHFGHVGIAEVAERVLLSNAAGEDIDAFLEEAVIRRELSFNLCFYRRDHDSLAALPDWARKTLDAHRGDRRKPEYTASELEAAATHDEVWNLAQRQLLVTGTMHGYLRMLWGKKAIEWMPTPEDAHAFLIAQHAKYALDGRDPNTHAGVLWCFGKHDRPWAPQRPIFGMIRYMSSESTRRKVALGEIEAQLQQLIE